MGYSPWNHKELDMIKHLIIALNTKGKLIFNYTWDFPGGSESKEYACHVGDLGSIPGSGRSPGERNGNLLQYLAWRIPWTEEAGGWRHKSQTQLSDFTLTSSPNTVTPQGTEC